jgi:hypothetical protein
MPWKPASRMAARSQPLLRGQQAQRQVLGLVVGVGGERHLVEAAAHVHLAALRVQQREVHGHAEAVDGAALGWGEVHRQRRALQLVPQALLHTLRAQRIEHQQPPAGAARVQPGGGVLQRLGRLAAQPVAVEAVVHGMADEVVGAGVAQVHGDAVAQAVQPAEMRVGGDVFDADGVGHQGRRARCSWAAAVMNFTSRREAWPSGALAALSR